MTGRNYKGKEPDEETEPLYRIHFNEYGTGRNAHPVSTSRDLEESLDHINGDI